MSAGSSILCMQYTVVIGYTFKPGLLTVVKQRICYCYNFCSFYGRNLSTLLKEMSLKDSSLSIHGIDGSVASKWLKS